MTFAHIRLHGGKLVEERLALRLAPLLDQGRHPFLIGRLYAETALPFRVEKPFIASGQIFSLNLVGIEGDHKIIHTVGQPQAVRRNRRRRQIGAVGRAEGRKELLARHHLHLRAVGLEHIDAMPLGLRFGHGSLYHLIGKGSPKLDLHAILFFECLSERLRFGRCTGSVKDDHTFLLRTLDKSLVPVRSAVLIDDFIALRRFYIGRCGGEHSQRKAQATEHAREATLASRDDRFCSHDRSRRDTCMSPAN